MTLLDLIEKHKLDPKNTYFISVTWLGCSNTEHAYTIVYIQEDSRWMARSWTERSVYGAPCTNPATEVDVSHYDALGIYEFKRIVSEDP